MQPPCGVASGGGEMSGWSDSRAGRREVMDGWMDGWMDGVAIGSTEMPDNTHSSCIIILWW